MTAASLCWDCGAVLSPGEICACFYDIKAGTRPGSTSAARVAFLSVLAARVAQLDGLIVRAMCLGAEGRAGPLCRSCDCVGEIKPPGAARRIRRRAANPGDDA